MLDFGKKSGALQIQMQHLILNGIAGVDREGSTFTPLSDVERARIYLRQRPVGRTCPPIVCDVPWGGLVRQSSPKWRTSPPYKDERELENGWHPRARPGHRTMPTHLVAMAPTGGREEQSVTPCIERFHAQNDRPHDCGARHHERRQIALPRQGLCFECAASNCTSQSMPLSSSPQT